MNHPRSQQITEQTQQWLQQVVIGLNLCPFAAAPSRRGAIRIEVTSANQAEQLIEALLDEMIRLDETPDTELETTLLVIPEMLQDFADYNQFLDIAEGLIEEYDREGIYQIASFHPDYCFAGTCPEDAENLTNRAPYPMLHLIREEQMEKVLAHYPDPQSIPDNNIRRVSALTDAQRKALFPYLFDK